MIQKTKRLQKYKKLHVVFYRLEYVARPLLLFFSSENRLLWFRYQGYDLAHLELVFEFSIYTVWKSVRYGVSNGLDTAYWGFLEQRPRLISSKIFTYYISNTAYWSSLDTAYRSCFLRGLWWYDELADGKLKDETLALKAKVKGSWGDATPEVMKFCAWLKNSFENFHELDYDVLVKLQECWWKVNAHEIAPFTRMENFGRGPYANMKTEKTEAKDIDEVINREYSPIPILAH
ncbi:hypothetical protein Tco_0369973 [Tanacetum coccineum]